LASHDHEVQLYAFDCLALAGDDLRALPLHMRKANLEQLLLRRRPEGIFMAPFERGEIGPNLFDAACQVGLEGLVSKHRERAYRGGRCYHWVKVKNRKHPRPGPVLRSGFGSDNVASRGQTRLSH
jgi:bifunctional non-homologous end joining protein LigD